MFHRPAFVTNSSSSSFVIWSKGDITPEMVKKWGIPERIAPHIKLERWDKRLKLDFSPEAIAQKLNGFRYELTPEWVDNELIHQRAWLKKERDELRNPPEGEKDLSEDKIKSLTSMRKHGVEHTKKQIKEWEWIKSLQEQGYKTYVYYCEDLAGLYHKLKPEQGGIDRTEVGMMIHLTLHEDEYHHNNYHQAVFNDNEDGGIRGVVYYIWAECIMPNKHKACST